MRARGKPFPRLAITAAVALGGIVFAVTWTGNDRPSKEASQDVEPAMAAPDISANSPSGMEIQRLREGMVEFKRIATNVARDLASLPVRSSALEQEDVRRQWSELASCHHDFFGPSGEAGGEGRPTGKGSPLPPQESLETAKAETQVLLQALDRRARSERFDGKWAGPAEKKIKDDFLASNVPGLNLVGAKCRSTMCRVELIRNISMPEEESMHRVISLAPWAAPSIAHVADTGKVVLYLAREGHELLQ